MATPRANLAASLTILRGLQRDGRRVFSTRELSRVHKERLLKNGFLQEAAKGWLISTAPDVREGDSTPWYSSFWEFCARYCNGRFRGRWNLSPEQSLLLHAEKTVIPTQVIIQSPAGTNHKIALLFGTSLFDLKLRQSPPKADLTVRDGLRVFTPVAALIRVSESFFSSNPVECRVLLSSLGDTTELLRRLLDGGHTVVAGRLAGALRNVNRSEAADEIIATMKAAGYDIRETNPFVGDSTYTAAAAMPPIVCRMQAMWESMRSQVLAVFPAPPGLPKNRKAFLKFVDEIYKSDAYHSLSIEGYSVSDELIERVKAGNWNPDDRQADGQSRDALAARGYWQAFQLGACRR